MFKIFKPNGQISNDIMYVELLIDHYICDSFKNGEYIGQRSTSLELIKELKNKGATIIYV